jgi:hypothetical protein
MAGTRRLLALGATAALLLSVAPAAGASHGKPAFPIRLRTATLPQLDGAFYELWVIRGKVKSSAGSFNVDGGQLVDGFGHRARFFSRIDPSTADAVAVTIEPIPDPQPGPSAVIVLAGEAGTDRARLRFPVGLGKATGSFILATPTDDENTNEKAGVWFLDPATGPGPSLTLPKLPIGWIFEGWGVTQGTPLSTGRFSMADGGDGASPFSGPKAGPPFPGEDFLANLPTGVTPPVNLGDGASMIVLTLEPDIGGTDPTGLGPFGVKPLAAAVASGAADHITIPLARDLSTVPRGRATY